MKKDTVASDKNWGEKFDEFFSWENAHNAILIIFVGMLIVFLVGVNLGLIRHDILSKRIYAKETTDYTAISGLNAMYSQKGVAVILEELQSFGLFGKHELIPLITDNMLQGHISGGILNFSGDLKTTKTLTFAWKTSDRNEYVATIPFNKVLFKEVAAGISPMVQFKFFGDQLMQAYRDWGEYHNVNALVTEGTVAIITIYIGQQDKLSNIYLKMD